MPRVVWGWSGFGALVLVMLALDLGLFHRKSREMGVRRALTWSAIWVGVALLFNAGIYFWRGGEKALQFFTAYTVEFSLSVDNLFVFLLIFGAFKVPAQYRHKVLFWGIIGALLMRGIFIAFGIALIDRLHWMTYVFGVFLIVCGARMALKKDQELHPDQNPILKLTRRFIPISPNYHGNRFFVKENGLLLATPLLLALLAIESSDLLFALDSVPAVLAITPDPFIVYTSNVFAMLGLRSLFFALEGAINRFYYLRYGISAVLAFVGVKMILSGVFSIPTGVSLLVILVILAVTILASQIRGRMTDIRKLQKQA